ncbi:MAG: hypothetical protein KKA62_02115 [Nanoarchaeota archaeon]|nr:hypothetical protein [Nanoarchaeota archaeon]MBU1644211.1 hypothetical protein [Nanoarchaeota archaeon]MBU1976730.1 hypothetical protein [Nanoarchaeota archaeon]
MAYIRTKKINNQFYAYLVESKSTSSGPRQKVKQYLGRVYTLEKTKEAISPKQPEPDSSKKILSFLVLSELEKIGFEKKREVYIFKNLIFSPLNNSLTKKNKSKSPKEAIISLNDGFLCSFTLKRISDFKKTKDFNKDAYLLAKHFLEAGLPISQELFVLFYQQLK